MYERKCIVCGTTYLAKRGLKQKIPTDTEKCRTSYYNRKKRRGHIIPCLNGKQLNRAVRNMTIGTVEELGFQIWITEKLNQAVITNQ